LCRRSSSVLVSLKCSTTISSCMLQGPKM
jgi:hypothetical protein